MTKHHRVTLALATFSLAFMALSAMSDNANAAVVYCTYIGYPSGCVARPGVRLVARPAGVGAVQRLVQPTKTAGSTGSASSQRLIVDLGTACREAKRRIPFGLSRFQQASGGRAWRRRIDVACSAGSLIAEGEPLGGHSARPNFIQVRISVFNGATLFHLDVQQEGFASYDSWVAAPPSPCVSAIWQSARSSSKL